MPAVRKFEILKAGADWWLFVPAAYLLGGHSETGRYHRRTFAEAVRLYEHYRGRIEAGRAVALWYNPDYRQPYWVDDTNERGETR